MGEKRTYDIDKLVGKATWIPGFIAFAVFAGIVGVTAYSSLANQISADPAPATGQAIAPKVSGSECSAVLDTDASAKQLESGYIRVAINNYWVPSGVASATQHKAYSDKTTNASYKCNEISVKVPNAGKCLTDSKNLTAVESYVTGTLKLGYSKSTTDFTGLTGDQMKKTVIGSSFKTKCLGGSDSYDGIGDDKQASDSKVVEVAKGRAEGVLSGGEDIKVATRKANSAVEKQVAQGQETGGSKSSSTSKSNTSANSNTSTTEQSSGGIKIPGASLANASLGALGKTIDNSLQKYQDDRKNKDARIYYSDGSSQKRIIGGVDYAITKPAGNVHIGSGDAKPKAGPTKPSTWARAKAWGAGMAANLGTRINNPAATSRTNARQRSATARQAQKDAYSKSICPNCFEF